MAPTGGAPREELENLASAQAVELMVGITTAAGRGGWGGGQQEWDNKP